MFSDIYGPHWMLMGIYSRFFADRGVLCGALWRVLCCRITKKTGPFVADPATSFSAPFVATLVDVTGRLKAIMGLFLG
jgi:magnesium transporter